MISRKIKNDLGNASWIRAMFEKGTKLRKIYGEENVFDFSLGNPDCLPPKSILESILKHSKEDENIHKYMNNAGYNDVRQNVANVLSVENGIDIPFENVVMSCGAAGGLNVVLKTILNPGDEVIVFTPFFVEYIFYIDNHNGNVIFSNTKKETFEPDINELERNISKNCKAIILNSPNNPTGVIYSKNILEKIAHLIKCKEEEYRTDILVISDEPYNKLVYDEEKLPSILDIFEKSIIINSFSKSLGLAGERIGYIAVSPKIDPECDLINGIIFANRILGYVNAPSLFQKVISDCLNNCIDIADYQNRRNFIYTSLTKLGFSCIKPQGAFYLFPKSLIDDDVAFTKHALKYNLLLVPGTGFGCPGYFRMAYCISQKKIEASINSFEKLAADFN